MSEIPVYMKHDLMIIPRHSLPTGYQFRFFGHQGDRDAWAKIVTKTNEFTDERNAIKRFNEEFSPHTNEAKKRIIFIVTNDGSLVGSATAWFGKWMHEEIGRLHWVEIIPEYQGRELGCPLITEAMSLLRKYHSSAYLKTQKSSQAAIYLYGQLGWYPIIKEEQETFKEN